MSLEDKNGIYLNEEEAKIWLENKDRLFREREYYLEAKKFEDLVTLKNDQLIDEVGKSYYHDGEHGWKCSESPINVCVYIYDEEFYDECCHYCGEPEERK